MRHTSISIQLILMFSLVLLSCNKKNGTDEQAPQTGAVAEAIGNPDDVQAVAGVFTLDKLPYKYDELSPEISAITMQTHYSKHYVAYTNNLNKAVKEGGIKEINIEKLLQNLDVKNAFLKNNAGGYYNHSLFWKCLSKDSQTPKDNALAAALDKTFGSFDKFIELFKAEANKQFGSGWVWLVVIKSGELKITSTANQDNPLMQNASIKGQPILALDLWEHAYYLDYKNRRPDYIDAYLKVINWKNVNLFYEGATKK